VLNGIIIVIIIIIIIITLIIFSDVFHTNDSHENKAQQKHFKVLTEHCHLAKKFFFLDFQK